MKSYIWNYFECQELNPKYNSIFNIGSKVNYRVLTPLINYAKEKKLILKLACTHLFIYKFLKE